MIFRQALARKLLTRTAPVLFFFILAFSAMEAGPARAQPGPADAAMAAGEMDYDSLTQIWSTRTSDLSALVDEAATLQNLAENLAAPLADKMAEARAQIARLSGLFQVSRGHPTEQLALLRQLQGATA